MTRLRAAKVAVIARDVPPVALDPDANKIEIRKAVEELFGKRVDKVHTINRKGKRKRNRRTGTWGTRASQKRAIVTLAKGEERIDIFGS
jgi:large subunit ribosomal protein L23